MKSGKNIASRKGLKICCGIAAIFSIILVVVFLILWFTTLKPKVPEITAHPYGLEKINPLSMLYATNITLNMVITIDNHQNVGSFKFKNATSYVNYHNNVVAEIPIGKNRIPSHGKLNINTTADLMVNKIIANPVFFDDVSKGSLNLIATATLHGKVSLFNFLKMPATAFSTCNITFFIASRQVESACKSKIKL